MKHYELFNKIYQRSPAYEVFCPYRICPLGAHIDHQKGKVTGLAIDKGIHISYGPKQNGVVEMVSLQFGKRAQWHVRCTPGDKQGDWADYLRGATIALNAKYALSIGVCGVIEGDLPIGGLSSSAAVTIAFLSALCKVNGLEISRQELAYMALAAENEYVGVSCGKLDQSCEIYAKKNHLLHLNPYDDTYELIPTNPNMKPYKIAIFFSGVERTLAETGYNSRVDECRAAAFTMLSMEGKTDKKLGEVTLRDVPYEVYLRQKDKLPENFVKRAEHWYGETDRVAKGVDAWRRGDIEEFGRLIFESGHSSIYNYETGSPELKALYEIMLETDGIYGGRFSGAGFKGCCMAIIDPEREEEILSSVERKYVNMFPELEGKFVSAICESADGVTL
ncbi:MAG: GHMP kinase [Clostridia bacterium]|nr:GHMP kinase [Clostridia bacterium]